MHPVRLTLLAVALVSLTACKQDATSSAALEGGAAAADAGEQSALRSGADAGSVAADEPQASKGGAFARKPDFQLPVPVSAAPVQGPSVSRSRQIDVAGVTAAVVDGLDGTGSSVKVQVQPGGIVSLSGEVANIAQLQRAHYLARAQPGVVEVDYRNLRVRQR